MKGGIFHEYILDKLEAELRAIGLRARRDVPTRKGATTGFIDLLAWSEGSDERLLIEVEMDSVKRVVDDCQKRRDMGIGDRATLWIVTPTERVARRVRRCLRTLEIDATEPIKVSTFFAAVQQIQKKIPFCFKGVYEAGNEKQKSKIPKNL